MFVDVLIIPLSKANSPVVVVISKKLPLGAQIDKHKVVCGIEDSVPTALLTHSTNKIGNDYNICTE